MQCTIFNHYLSAFSVYGSLNREKHEEYVHGTRVLSWHGTSKANSLFSVENCISSETSQRYITSKGLLCLHLFVNMYHFHSLRFGLLMYSS